MHPDALHPVMAWFTGRIWLPVDAIRYCRYRLLCHSTIYSSQSASNKIWSKESKPWLVQLKVHLVIGNFSSVSDNKNCLLKVQNHKKAKDNTINNDNCRWIVKTIFKKLMTFYILKRILIPSINKKKSYILQHFTLKYMECCLRLHLMFSQFLSCFLKKRCVKCTLSYFLASRKIRLKLGFPVLANCFVYHELTL